MLSETVNREASRKNNFVNLTNDNMSNLASVAEELLNEINSSTINNICNNILHMDKGLFLLFNIEAYPILNFIKKKNNLKFWQK